MILQQINNDVIDEFANLRNDLKTHFKPQFDVSQTKEFLESHIPKEIVYKSEVLLDTLLNYLMEQARKDMEQADVELQNKFFEAEFRKRIHNWAEQIENQLKLEPNIVEYSSDTRWKQGLIAGGIAFIVGSGITTTAIPTFIGAIVSGIVTIVLSALAFKMAYKQAEPKARELLKDDIEKYLTTAEAQVNNWLKSVIDAFSNDLDNFCSSNGFKLAGNLNEK